MICLRVASILLILTFVDGEPLNNTNYMHQRALTDRSKSSTKYNKRQHTQYGYTSETNINRKLEDVWTNTCGITDFSVYDSVTGTPLPLAQSQWNSNVPITRIILDGYPKSRMSIIANIDMSECPDVTIKCVSMQLGDFQHQKETTAPYTLYGKNGTTSTPITRYPKKVGFQPLVGRLYETADCSGTYYNEMRLTVHIVPKQRRTIQTRIIVVYDGTKTEFPLPKTKKIGGKNSGSLNNPVAVAEVVKSTCDFLHASLFHEFMVNGEVNFDMTDCQCSRVGTKTADKLNGSKLQNLLKITYRIAPTYVIHTTAVDNGNENEIPTTTELSSIVTKLFLDEKESEAYKYDYGNEYRFMSTKLRHDLSPLNAYSNFTSISVID
jgi:hypothetical protein